MNIERLLLRFYALHLDFNDVKNRPSYLACQPNEAMDIVHLPIFSAIYWQLQALQHFLKYCKTTGKSCGLHTVVTLTLRTKTF